jgi:methylmalonyl-CoA mutase N-terminal domain/subunit
MTDGIEAEAEEYLRKIDSMGGMLRAIETGYVQGEIQESAYRHQRQVESGEAVIVGLNRYTSEEPPSIETLVVDDEVNVRRREAVHRLREERDAKAAASALSALRQAALGSGNLLPWIVDAVCALCTVGEISDCLRGVFGEYRESVVV